MVPGCFAFKCRQNSTKIMAKRSSRGRLSKNSIEPQSMVIGMNHIWTKNEGKVRPIVDPGLPESAYSDWIHPDARQAGSIVTAS